MHRASLTGLDTNAAASVAALESLGADVRAAFFAADGDTAAFAVANNAFGISWAEDDGTCGVGVGVGGGVRGDGVREGGWDEEEEGSEFEEDHGFVVSLRISGLVGTILVLLWQMFLKRQGSQLNPTDRTTQH